MKKITLLAVCLILTAALLGGCACEHTWVDADCETPKTCSQCQETEGAPAGHVWKAADCLTAKTCQVCQKTESEALGHAWQDADCENPMTCTNCNLVQGKALGHSWREATTEAPKTCETCLAIEGTAIQTDERFTTAACQELFGTWICNYTVDGEAETGMSIPGEDLDYIMIMIATFHNDGTWTMEVQVEEESYLRVTRIVAIEETYLNGEMEGMTRDEIDAALLQAYGMDVEGYVDAVLAQLDLSQMTYSMDMVYYVKDGVLYDSDSWSGEFDETEFTISGSVLTMGDELDGVETVMEFEKQP